MCLCDIRRFSNTSSTEQCTEYTMLGVLTFLNQPIIGNHRLVNNDHPTQNMSVLMACVIVCLYLSYYMYICFDFSHYFFLDYKTQLLIKQLHFISALLGAIKENITDECERDRRRKMVFFPFLLFF